MSAAETTPRGLTTIAERSPRRRRLANRIATIWMIVALLMAVVPLLIILTYVLMRGLSALNLDFITEATAVRRLRDGRRLPQRRSSGRSS